MTGKPTPIGIVGCGADRRGTDSDHANRRGRGRAVGSPGYKVMADFFHMNIKEVDMGQAIENAAEHIAYVHLADSNRFQPGAGHLDFEPGLAALKRIGYEGFMTLECRIMGEDKGQALIESAQYVRENWNRV